LISVNQAPLFIMLDAMSLTLVAKRAGTRSEYLGFSSKTWADLV